jgi:hypothetical protein
MAPGLFTMSLTARSRLGVLGITLGLLLAACGGADEAVGPQAWIDAPQHDSTHPSGPLEIIVHAAELGGVAMVEISVNGEVLVRRAPDDTTAPLTTFRIDWVPQYGGEIVLTARAYGQNGVWGEVTTNTVTIVGPVVANALPAVQQPATATPPSQPTAARPASTRPPTLPTPTPPAACTDKVGFVADVTLPDDTQVSPNQPLTKVWRLRNDGTCPWNEEYKVVFVGGDAMSNNTPLPVFSPVPPGATVDLAVDLLAPNSNGTYRGDYQMRNPQGVHFGVGASGQTPFYIQIVVGSQAPPPRPTSPPAPDIQAPSITVSHDPSGGSLPTGSTITFTATASDNVGVARIDLWVTAPGGWPTPVKTCNNQSTCSFSGGPYSTQGNLSYFAIARDAAGNETNSAPGSILLYVVISSLLRLPL